MIISDAVLIALVSSIPVTVTSIAALIIAIKNTHKVEEIHKATNSMKDALVLSTEKEALARGIKQGTTEEKARILDNQA